MKKRIGTLYGKPVVIGDKNLVTDNEVYIPELSKIDDSKIFHLNRITPEEFCAYIVSGPKAPNYYWYDFDVLYTKELLPGNSDNNYIIQFEESEYPTDSSDSVIYMAILPKGLSQEQIANYKYKIVYSNEDDDHSVNAPTVGKTSNIPYFILDGETDSSEGTCAIGLGIIIGKDISDIVPLISSDCYIGSITIRIKVK